MVPRIKRTLSTTEPYCFRITEGKRYTHDMVGPVGFEPTISGLNIKSLRSPAPQVHRARLRSGILLAESCSQTKLPRECVANLF